MKRMLITVLIVSLLTTCALAEGGAFTLRFDEGFRLSLPEGWVSYPSGGGAIRYALGDGAGRYMYILFEETALEDFDALRQAIDAHDGWGKSSPLDLNGQPFAAFVAKDLNASGCATLLDGEALIFLFTPQDDSDYMLTVARIMASWTRR